MSAAPHEDLSGEIHEREDDPPKIPPRSGAEYRWHLRTLPLPDGLKFFSQAPNDELALLPPRVSKFAESIWCRSGDGRDVRLLVDLRTGERYGSG
jgi:hypothetical protein